MSESLRHLVLVLGDQLDRDSAVFDDFDPATDAVWMAEVDHEATQVWSGKPRIALFLAAMRRFRDELRERGWTVHYRCLGEHDAASLEQALADDLARLRPRKLLAVRPGEWRLAQSLPAACKAADCAWVERPDRHFYCDGDDFAQWAKGRREYRMEHFYRWLRRREGVLLDNGEPAGGRWNFDAANRGRFDRRGPGWLPAPRSFAPDPRTKEVLALVEDRFAGHPGKLDAFDWPLDPAQAREALDDFIAHRLPLFGRYQDAMWAGEPWLYHSRLSAAMNLKLIGPREVVAAVEAAWRDGQVPIEAAEGFIRQVLGWREFVRGVYWLRMPDFLEQNQLGADQSLPAFYWTGDTDMACLRDSLRHTLDLGYGHHIERLMVLGLFALLLGVRPKLVHEWFLAVYVDAVEWVELPNVLGMALYADGGRMVSKPYAASGKYIQRMSNHCSGCRFRPDEATGESACPFTTLYWDFLVRHRERFERHPRTALQWSHLGRRPDGELEAVQAQAAALRDRLAAGSRPQHGDGG
ncbi:MAG TPA: cryptochrome/photolyase family protein [Arenimonas sp.]